MKFDLRLKIIISIALLICLGFVLYQVADHSPEYVTTGEARGEIEFKLYDESQSLVIDDELLFYDDDTLYTILLRHYDLTCADSQYQPDDSCSFKFIHGYALLGIDDVLTNWYTSFLSIYVNGEVAIKGVSLIEPRDGDLIEIKVMLSE
jgi:hypothetical protein